jgi:hypothetical protein
MPNYLFASVIPSSIKPVRPTAGVGNPNGFVSAPPGQLYTDDTGAVWIKAGLSPMTGWVLAGDQIGMNPAVYIGNYFEYDPNDLFSAPGPAIWLGNDQSVWIKTVSTNDDQDWVFLAFDPSIGEPNFYVQGGGDLGL